MRLRTTPQLLFLTGVFSTACGPNPSLVTGQLALSLTPSSAPWVLAVGAEGPAASVPLDEAGRFTLTLEGGRAYALGFVKEQAPNITFATVVAVRDALPIALIHVPEEKKLELGRLTPVVSAVIADPAESTCRDAPGAPPPPTANPNGDAFATTTSLLVASEEPAVGEAGIPAEDPGTPLSDLDGDHRCDALDNDDDGDGVCDGSDDDGDSEGDEDDDADSEAEGEDPPDPDDGRAELPYDARLSVGQEFSLRDSFAEKGPQPAEILGIEMEDGTWRLAELRAAMTFTIDQADCDHVGNRGVGRDRIFVSWRNADGSTEIDHLDLRYCD